jgi:tetratricopeptide (TPR) repeat protein
MIIFAALVTYYNSFAVPLLLDDLPSVQDNLSIRHLWPIWQALSPPTASFMGGRPVVNLSLALNYALGGTSVWGYHAFNLAVHLLAALTLYGIVRRTLARPGLRERFGSSRVLLATSGASGEWIALAVALLWTVHPLQTEAVTYISQRCESLMGLFYLLTLYGFIRGTDSPRSGGWFALSVAACFLGMASKEVMVTAPVMVLLYDRTFVSGSFRQAWSRHWRLYLGLASSWLLLGYLMAGLHDRSVGYGLGISWWGYALTECRAVVQYLRLALWPYPLVFDYGFYVPTKNVVAVAPYALILVVLATAVWVGLRRCSSLGFVGAWFFVILAPTSSVVPIVGSPIAEHRMYLPLAAVATMAVLGGYAWIGRRSLLVLFVVASVLGLVTIQRNQDYQSVLNVWQDTVEKDPGNARAHYSLGNGLFQAGGVEEAIGHYQQALQTQPDYVAAHNSLGVALMQQGRLQEAIGHFEQALRIRPDYAEAHNDLGIALMRQGRLQEAVGQYEQALRIRPDYAEAHSNWGNALFRLGKVQEAMDHWEQALRIKPDYAEAHNNLGNALFRLGKVQEAIGQYEQALRIKPDYTQAQNNLARARSVH